LMEASVSAISCMVSSLDIYLTHPILSMI